MKKEFYIYAHINPKTNEPFYVGKGTGKRAYETRGRSGKWHETVRELNADYSVEILEKGLSKEEAEEREYQYIKKFGKLVEGKGPLINLADGVWGLREEVNLYDLAIQELKIALEDPEFVKSVNKMSRILNKMRKLGMSEGEIEEWYMKEIHDPVTKELDEEEGIAECEHCGLISDVEEIIDGRYCPGCKKRMR